MVDYEVIENTVRINALNWAIEPSIEDSEACMAVVIDVLLEVKNAERVILAEAREREYDFEQVKLLREIAQAYNKILNEEKLISITKFGPKACEKFFPKRLTDLQFLVGEVLRKDPIGAYVRLQKMIAYEKMAEEKAPAQFKACHQEYLENVLLPMERILSNCKLIQLVKPKLSQFKFGDRSFYREIFHPLIRPNFMLTRYMLMPPKNGQSLKKYFVGKTSVEIFKVPGKIRYVYHVIPPEFVLSEEKYTILDAARRYLTAHRPSETEFTEPEKAREVFMNISRDLIRDVAASMGIRLEAKEIEELAEILTRYTAGFGVLEILLSDENVQDVYINSPIGTTPIFINHAEFEECETNLIPTREDAESWATRFRLYSGRPLDEANPVLDTELILPGGRARVAAITRTLSPYGLGYAFRRHREKPWTFPLFIKVGFFDSLYAGLMSFIIEGGRSLLVAGGRGSGKTSLLGAIMLEIMKKFRICLVEDSVAGDSEILIKRDGRFERTSVGNLIDELITKYGCIKIDGREILNKNPEKIQVFSINSKGKLTLSTVSSFARHKTSKPIYEIETRTGRKIRTTGDHSLFTLGTQGKIEPVKVSELKVGDYLAVPRILRFDNKGIEEVNLLDHLDKLQDARFYGKGIKKLIEENKNLIKKLAIELGYKVQDKHKYPQVVQSWKKRMSLPAKVVSLLIKNGIKLDEEELKIKCEGKSHSLPVKIVLDEDFLTFLGLWLADGCYDKKSVIVSVVDKDTRKCVKRVAKRFGINARMHSDGFSLILPSKLLKEVMMKVFELKGDAYSKRIPIWCFSLSRAQISRLLKGIFSGDGYLSKYEVAISLTSLGLIKDIQTLLLSFGIISIISEMNERDKTYSCRISGIKNIFQFFNEIGFLQEERMRRLGEMCCRAVTHDVTDIVPFSPIFKEKMSLEIPNFNSHDYIKRGYNIGRNCLNEILVEYGHETEIFEKMNLLANSDIFWDQVRSIKAIGSREDYVYDFSVPGNENFVCENFIAHNTLELPAVQLRELGYNIERLKTRSVITRVEAELPAEEALRTALRLGDSVLIVGEVRSSLRGDQEVMVVEDGFAKRYKIAELEGKNIEGIEVPTLDRNFVMRLEKLHHFVKHPPRDKFIEILTTTGRKAVVTPEHSVFTVKDFEIKETRADELKPGSSIVIPAKLPTGFNNLEYLDLIQLLPDFRLKGAENYIRKAIKKIGWKNACRLCGVRDVYMYLRPKSKVSRIPVSKFLKLMGEGKIKWRSEGLKIKSGTSKELPAKLRVDNEFCRFLGYYISEGWISGEKIFISNSDKTIIKDLISLIKKLFKIKPNIRKTKGWGEAFQVIIAHKPLATLIKRLGCGNFSKNKRIPPLIFGLSEEKIYSFLEGLYKGDGYVIVSKSSGNGVVYFTKSYDLANDLLYLLLSLGIVANFQQNFDKRYKNFIYRVVFKKREEVKNFLKHVNLVKKSLVERQFSHTKLNSISFEPSILERYVKLKREFRHLKRYGRCSKYYLQKVVEKCEADEKIVKFANGEFFVDRVKEVKEILLDKPEYVYDLSVNPTQNFVGGFGGILLHNTEAQALFEAMRIGALANLVAGTIHGESAYGVYDRVVNDLKVPPTSFKAMDVITICNLLKTPDGLRRFRRVTELTEVRKHWKQDPADEGGFVPLMEYSAKEDRLKPTDVLISGESFVLNEIAKRVREWHGNWDAVWDNILLRGKIKQTMVDFARQLGRDDILEAEMVVESNEAFHMISEQVREEVGALDSKMIYERWLNWFKERIK